MTNNIACRVFKEQIKLINQLPENERPIVLYLAINNCFNQFDFQNDYQIENQNENAYISVSVSESQYLNQLSEISKCVLELLKKNIVCKEFSTNYGGKRDGSGRKKEKREVFKKPTIEEVEQYCKERNNGISGDEFFNFYESKGWMIGKSHMKDWKSAVRTWERRKPPKKESVFEHNMRMMKEMEEENANENLF